MSSALGAAIGAGADVFNTALGTYAGYRIGQKADKTAFERQLYMMSHAHQLEVEDLRAAGLNPILSAGGSGASASGVSNTTAGSAMSGGSVGHDVGKQLSSVMMDEVQSRAAASRATAAKELALADEAKRRADVEYGSKKRIGEVRDSKGNVLSPAEEFRIKGAREIEREGMELRNRTLGVDAVKGDWLKSFYENHADSVMPATMVLDALKGVTNTALDLKDLFKWKGGK